MTFEVRECPPNIQQLLEKLYNEYETATEEPGPNKRGKKQQR